MTTLGNFELLEEIGRGGFGTVYRATDRALGRTVALKVLHPQLAADHEFIERFRREARTAAEFDHPNLVMIHQAGEVDGRFFIAMQFLPGGSLAARVKQGPLPAEQTLHILTQVCAGLAALHEHGTIHRDLKPANILFNARGEAVITDFGLARAHSVSSSSSTTAGMAGTPCYRAPELWRGKPPATPATDVYSLGCILAELLTGCSPFRGDTPDEVLTRHLIDGPDFGPAWPPPGVPAALVGVVERALARDPAGRYADAAALARALEGALRVEQAAARAAEQAHLAAEEHARRAAEEKSQRETAERAAQEKARAEAAKRTPLKKTPANEMRVALADGVELILVCVPAGEFLMGAADAAKNADSDEKPQHKVHLDEFWMGKYPVTNAQYRAFLQAAQYPYEKKLPKGKDDHPVVYVSWQDATAFCTWAAQVSGVPVRLPSEAQWEKAARGTDGRTYPWGEQEPDANLANFNSNDRDTTEVGRYPKGASPYGALDMAGNVWEWVNDWYGDYSVSPASNPPGPTSGNTKVLRGGSWYDSGSYLRVAYRNYDSPTTRGIDIGFRCAASPGR